MSDSLIKLIDKSLLPASLLVVGKFIGLFVIIKLLGIDWNINFSSDIFGIYPVVQQQYVASVSNFSDVFMVLVMFVGYGYYILQAVLFHDSHINPRTVTKLLQMNLLGIIQNTSQIYYSGGVWMFFSALSIILVLIDVFSGRVSWIILLVSIVIFVVGTGYLIKDIEDEMTRAKKNLNF